MGRWIRCALPGALESLTNQGDVKCICAFEYSGGSGELDSLQKEDCHEDSGNLVDLKPNAHMLLVLDEAVNQELVQELKNNSGKVTASSVPSVSHTLRNTEGERD